MARAPQYSPDMKGRMLGQILVRMCVATKEQVREGLQVQQARGGPLGRILVELEYIDEKLLSLALAYQAGMEYVDLRNVQIDEEVLSQIPAQMATVYRVVPLDYEPDRNRLVVALGSADDFRAIDDLQTLMGFKVTAMITEPEMIDDALKRYYGEEEETISSIVETLASDQDFQAVSGRAESIDLETIRTMADSSPVKRLVNLVLLEAIRNRASDIHFEPFEDEFKMRYRIDGVLYEMLPPPPVIAVAVASRLKVMANLNIAERRKPQDGRVELVVNGQPIDLRVSVLPTMAGESVVLRVLDRSQVSLDLQRLGMEPDDLRRLRELIRRPNGICIVTGPTGCGKTTTLYAALNELNDESVKILTTEDPVEYDIDGMIQVQINEGIGLTFARCLRHFLRQDPDIILVGEIRDLETAEIAAQASLTGHLVFTTLHTNDAPSTIARLLDLGLEPFLVTATLEAIVAQRLIRTICSRCKEEFEPTEQMLMELNLTPEEVKGKRFHRGKGCQYCRGTGYSGRRAIFEIMMLDDETRDLIMKRSSTSALRAAAARRGMRTLRESGLLAIYNGETTIEEVVQQTIYEELD